VSETDNEALKSSGHGKLAELKKVLSAYGAAHKYDCTFHGIKVSGDRVQKGILAYDLTECAIDMIDGGKPARMTATRIGAGAILAGPVGAIIGGMAKKDRSKTYIVVAHAPVRGPYAGGGSFKEEVPKKDRAKAMAFVRSFEMAQAAATVQH